MVSQAERRAATLEAILSAARKRFAKEGFAATTIDDIARLSGIAKGAVYHHFKSKEEIFEQVVDAMQAELAVRIPAAAAAAAKNPLDMIVHGTQAWLATISEPGTRRIILIDGPAILGWDKWREIDVKYFGRPMKAALTEMLKGKKSLREIEALFHLLTGALTEAALVCAASTEPARQARELANGFRALLEGVL